VRSHSSIAAGRFRIEARLSIIRVVVVACKAHRSINTRTAASGNSH
jgi:hypothetical protein